MDYDRFTSMDECKSEVARLRYQIDLEYRAAELALHGFATGVARHEFINAKMDRVGVYRQELAQFVGDLEATKICAEIIDGPDIASSATLPKPMDAKKPDSNIG
jgi:hypothetical protein